MRWREVFQYEMELRVHSASTWIYFGILFLAAIWMFLATADGGPAASVNAPERIAGGSALVGMFGMLVTAALFGDAAVRDVQAGMDPLLFTSPVRKAEYLGGRFLAALAVNAVLLVAILLGFLVATRIAGSFEAVGPFRIGAYVQAYLLFLLPNLVVIGAIMFAIGMLARQVIPVYLGAIGLFIGNLIAASALGGENQTLFALTDSFGLIALEHLTRYWTAAERNTQLVGFPAMLVWNRVVWLAVAVAVLTLLVRSFRFAHPDHAGRVPSGRVRLRSRSIPDGSHVHAGPVHSAPVAVPRVAGSFGLRTMARQTLAVARNSLAEIAANRWFAVVLLACTGLPMLFGWNVGDTVFDTSTWPVTFLVAEEVLSLRFVPIIYLLIAMYAGELVWKEREVGVAEIADAVPVADSVALLGRLLALVAMIAMFQAASMVGGMLIQLLQGYCRLEPDLYLEILFGLKLADYVLLAVLAMTIHVIVNHKYLGHIVVLMAFASTVVLRQLGIVEHHLLLYGTDPGWKYSDMNGFGPFVGPFVWFKLYWGAWALLLAVVAVLFWVRGREPGVRGRLRQARARFIGPVARTAGSSVVLIVVLGGFVFYNTNILNEYRSQKEAGRTQAEYEKRYARFEKSPQPVITDAELREEIYPGEPAVDMRGSYDLVNRTGAAIDSVHVSFMDPNIQVRSISFDRAARPVLVDDEVRYRIFALEHSLEPGDSLQLAFDVSYRPRGFPNGGIQTEVVDNGASFNRSLLPFIGYQPMFELSDDEARRRFGLGPRPDTPGPEEAEARRYRWPWRDADLVHVETVVGTAADQMAVTPGVLRRSWTENGRRYFHYETEAPTAFGATIYSGEYEVLEDRWVPSSDSAHAVALSIYHHPTHAFVLDRTVRSMKASLEYYTTHFGPYPYRQLRIVEYPRYGGFGIAHPYTIAFTEDYFFSRVREGEVDQPFYGTAHEIAHTWWGGQVRGAPVRGRGLLTESLANYSAMMVTEKSYGPEVARKVYDFQMDRYLRGRANQSREVPLLEVEDQPYIAYRKGAIAMYTLRDFIGEERVNAALRRYLEKYRDSGPPYPTSLDLYAELRAVTPDSLQYLLKDLFETVTLWGVGTERASVESTGTGEYRVTLDVVAEKVRADSVGKETEVPMNDFVEIGVFAPGAGEGAELGEPLYLKRHRIRSGKQTITVIVPREPARAGIDPYHELIDREGHDNVVGVEAAGADPVGARPRARSASAPAAVVSVGRVNVAGSG